MANETIGINFLSEAINHTNITGIEYVIPIAIIVFTLLIITRKINRWPTLFFPVTLMWHLAGVTQHIATILVSSIFFVINIFGLETIRQSISTIGSGISKASTDIYKTTSYYKKASQEAFTRKAKSEALKEAERQAYLNKYKAKATPEYIYKQRINILKNELARTTDPIKRRAIATKINQLLSQEDNLRKAKATIIK